MSGYMPDIPDQDRDALASYDRLAEDGPEEREPMRRYVATYLQEGETFSRYFFADDHDHACDQAADSTEDGEALIAVEEAS